MMFSRGYSGACFGYNGFGGIWHLLIIAGITMLIIALVIHAAERKNITQASETALETLKMKFVQGEITEEEYLKRKSILKK